MEDKKEVKPVLELVHRQDIFKIVIPVEVEKKIRFLCKNIWDVEWSGILFYKVEGAFEDKSQRVVLKLGIINLINRLIRHEY